jgi:hypothetical protein
VQKIGVGDREFEGECVIEHFHDAWADWLDYATSRLVRSATWLCWHTSCVREKMHPAQFCPAPVFWQTCSSVRAPSIDGGDDLVVGDDLAVADNHEVRLP